MLKPIAICLLLLIYCMANAQHTDVLPHQQLKDTLDKQLAKLKKMSAELDSIQATQLQRLSEHAHNSDSTNMARGIDAFVRLKQGQDKKLTTQLWIKGSFFACMLAVTVVGFLRRKRQKVKG